MNLPIFKNEPIESFASTQEQEAMFHALAQVKTQLGNFYPLQVGSQLLVTGSEISSRDPSEPSEVVGRVAAAGVAEAELALNAAWEAFPLWSSWSQEARSLALVKAAAIMRRRKLELAAWMVYEIGKNWREAAADVAEAIDFLEYYARAALRYSGPEAVPAYPYPGEDNTSFYQPLGAGVVIPPWNFPLAILTGMTMGPVAVGNTVVVKPASETPVIAAKLFEILDQAGFPAGVANYLPGSGAVVGEYLVANPRTRFINFTGSLEVGLHMHELAAKTQPGQPWLKRVALELGGKDAIMVDETADLDLAAEGIVASAFGFQGQKCSAASRVIVLEGVHEPLVHKVVELTHKLQVGEAAQNPDLGPVASQSQARKFSEYLEIAQQEGQIVAGGQRLEGAGYFFAPTVVDYVAPTARIAREEIFAPLLAIIGAADFDIALEIANSTGYGLTGGLYSQSRARLEQARRQFAVGNLYLNRKITGALVGVQPFGGFGLSGTNSKAGGPDYLGLFLEMKTVTEKF
jgi:1-pyrroline-5-carboxylate dehydrogenase